VKSCWIKPASDAGEHVDDAVEQLARQSPRELHALPPDGRDPRLMVGHHGGGQPLGDLDAQDLGEDVVDGRLGRVHGLVELTPCKYGPNR